MAIAVDGRAPGKTEFPPEARPAQNCRVTLFRPRQWIPSTPELAVLSLQDKLDHISRERKVLAILRDLVRHGLHDGDDVRHRAYGCTGAG